MTYKNRNDSQDDSVIMNISAHRIYINRENKNMVYEKNVEYGMDTSTKNQKSKIVEEEGKLTAQIKKKFYQTPGVKKGEKQQWRKGIKSSIENRDSPP
jgi:hypothetical protein